MFAAASAPTVATAAAIAGRLSTVVAAASDLAPAALVLVWLVLAAGWWAAKR